METREERPVRTFHPRRGRSGKRHADALAELWPAFGLTVHDGDRTPLDLDELFGRAAPKVLEIGFGMGDATAAMAAADPGRDYLAAEVHTPGVGNLLALVGEQHLTNIRVAHGDVMQLIHRIPAGSLDAIHVFFPDPWPKLKHHKRRLIQPGNVVLLRRALRVGGVLHCATDWPHYAESMAATLSADPGLTEVAASKRPWTKTEVTATERPQTNTGPTATERPWTNTEATATERPQTKTQATATERPQTTTQATTTERPQTTTQASASERPRTKFERRGVEAGRPIADLVYRHDAFAGEQVSPISPL